jgi:plastocyanin
MGGGGAMGGGSGAMGGGSGAMGGGSGAVGGGSGAVGGGSGATLCTNPDGGADTYAGCDTWEDHTAASDARTVTFGAASAPFVSPTCMEVKSGQTVHITAGVSHPGDQACGPANGKLVFPDGTTTDIMLTTPGVYGYFCTVHGFTAGIKVDP